jgi:hypothetical protein
MCILLSQDKSSEIKRRHLNATAGTRENMLKRAASARELGVPIVLNDEQLKRKVLREKKQMAKAVRERTCPVNSKFLDSTP